MILSNILFLIKRNKLISKIDYMMDSNRNLNDKLSKSTTNIDQLGFDNANLKSTINSMKREKRKMLEIQEGDRVLITQNLDHTTDGKKKSITVLFECNVTQASENKLKLNATDALEDSYVLGIKKECLIFFQNKWMNRTDCELIIDDKHRRDSKLDELINDI